MLLMGSASNHWFPPRYLAFDLRPRSLAAIVDFPVLQVATVLAEAGPIVGHHDLSLSLWR
ncbi:hypothetical protein MES4922_120169 [Mesorhizobium ventifaucium]|uniref:Uncharacterized protein n=1 Tax=Mesorhizobium ventifaucium TaxID=666020 RepID=A0ABN8JD53_9HYPH|nr:hypothetical protein MES4922_120169 [Mesorhizobium ventifaucium]